MTNPIQRIHDLGQSIWYDNMRRGLIKSGELRRLIDMGITGLTSNPTIFEKAIAGSADYDDDLRELSREPRGVDETYEALALEDIQAAADMLRPAYDRTDGRDGLACLEVSPALAHDTQGTIAEGRRLFAALNRPNVMVKVPATPAGMPAIRSLIGEGINVNVTLIFSQEAYAQAREAYIGGLEDLARAGGDVTRVASVASFFVSRVDTLVDSLLDKEIKAGRAELKALLGKAAVANAKIAYRAFQEVFHGERFAALRNRGARPQRPLWASTSTKNPAYGDLLYVENLVGPETVNTMPPATITALMEHGGAELSLERDVDQAAGVIRDLERAGISMQAVTARLLEEGVKAFADSFDKMLANIEAKEALLSRRHARPQARLGNLLPHVESTLEGLGRQDAVRRIWARDHTVWKPDPTEIANRLGWLDIAAEMMGAVSDLEDFAQEMKRAGIRHVVLMGMGGSSLGPEVLRQTFGSAPGFPELIVLDSTVPACVRAVTAAIDPARTLFLFSSKSGGTIEPSSMYRHFRGLVEHIAGGHAPEVVVGAHFAAITDPGTSLEHLAREAGFHRVFLNNPNIGGRYSVLSHFGMAPAALAGLNVRMLLERAGDMRERCGPGTAVRDNPGAWLGAMMGEAALKGRDKLTLVLSPAIASFGLWAEQLIAESTGKEGKGIVPVAGEPLLGPRCYGNDRLFVHLRLAGDDNAAIDAAMRDLREAGQPVARLELADRYDLGAEFYRWEFATAVAGAVLGINPFDQPNVQEAKDLTSRVLQEYSRSGRLPEIDAPGSIGGLLSGARQGDYVAIMPYLRETPGMNQALASIRRAIMESHRIATTVGYGPRFLHSTGQLHKGGPNTGLFLQLTAASGQDVPIPGESYTFGALAAAQALGDLRALHARGRRAIRVELQTGSPEEILRLAGREALVR